VTTLSCAEARLSLGAYVVGALDPDDRITVEHHLESCPACRDELSDLAGLPGLLARVDVTELLQGEPSAPPELLDRLLAAAATDNRVARRRRFMAAAAAVAIASAGTAAAAAQIAEGHNTSPPAVTAQGRVLTAADATTHVAARISEQPKNWGTAVRVQLTGVPEGETCSLVVVSRSGEHEVAATWKVNYTGDVDVQGASAWAAADIASYAVVTADGEQLVSVPA
jgi:predicted anti-sigma-YlaC factor YlaD